ncbi:MAG: Hsp70 family protein [Clostridiales bacterium]
MSIIGIDLGTTNSMASVYIDNELLLIPNVYGEYITPSVVSYSENKGIITGKAAKQLITTNPEKTAFSFKKAMGTDRRFTLGNESFDSSTLASFIITSLKNDAEIFLNKDIKEVIISVPAYFNDKQRKSTINAAEMTGLKVLKLINEPTAAAIAYGFYQPNEEKRILVLDIGGGTFDVSLMEIYKNTLEVIAIAGDNFLGGEDFDNILIDYFINENNIKCENLSFAESNELRIIAEKCKINLSKNDSTNMIFNTTNNKYNLEITNNLLSKISLDLLLKMKVPILKVFNDSKINLNDINDIVLVGGTTNMPIIKDFIRNIFDRNPISFKNPDEIVAMGVGICTGIEEKNEVFNDIVLIDVCPFTLGTDISDEDSNGITKDGIFSPIIKRNTIIPCSETESYDTTKDNQEEIYVPIYQGESKFVKDNFLLGEIVINVPPKPNGEVTIDVKFTYNYNGILDVEVISEELIKKGTFTILNTISDQDIDKYKKTIEKLKKYKINSKYYERNINLIERAKRIYEETTGNIRYLVGESIDKFEDSIENLKSYDKLRLEIKNFEEFLNNIELGEL